MGSSRYVGRVGALAVALGIGTAIASPSGVAWAQPDSGTSTSSSSSNASEAGPASGADTDTNSGGPADTTAAFGESPSDDGQVPAGNDETGDETPASQPDDVFVEDTFDDIESGPTGTVPIPPVDTGGDDTAMVSVDDYTNSPSTTCHRQRQSRSDPVRVRQVRGLHNWRPPRSAWQRGADTARTKLGGPGGRPRIGTDSPDNVDVTTVTTPAASLGISRIAADMQSSEAPPAPASVGATLITALLIPGVPGMPGADRVPAAVGPARVRATPVRTTTARY